MPDFIESGDTYYHSGRHGWGNQLYGNRYYVTQKGYQIYNSEPERFPPIELELWADALFDQEPKTRVAYIDRTNDLFNSRQTRRDHHEAEYFAARMQKEGLISFDPMLDYSKDLDSDTREVDAFNRWMSSGKRRKERTYQEGYDRAMRQWRDK